MSNLGKVILFSPLWSSDKDIYVKKTALETYQNLPVYLYFHGGAFLAGSWLSFTLIVKFLGNELHRLPGKLIQKTAFSRK